MTQIDSTLSSFGELLKSFRKRQHLTQQHLAAIVGVHRGTLIHWEQGDFLPESKTMVLEVARHLHLDDQETRRLLEASLTALIPHWLVPLPRNPFFTGREEILEELHAQLRSEQAVALTQSSALHGLGGVGKTQIALEYAYRHALEYSAVFWIAAEADEQVVASLLHIAEALQLLEREDNDQQRVVAAVRRWLSTHGQWLLIWDNIEDLTILQRFLPGTRSGTMLLTTRCQVLGSLARGLDLLPMEQEEGLLFLLRRAKVLSPDATREQVCQFTEQLPEQYAAASELVTILGGLPLALDQAGAYLEETSCGLPAYLDLFYTRRDALLKLRGEGIQDHPASVSTTFTLAIAAAARRHPAVRDLLQVCALLQPDAIPEEIFCQGGKHLGPVLEVICRDPLEWDRVIASACSYSLLSRQPEEQALSLHRLVQAVLLDGMTEAEQEQWNKRVIAALDAIFPEVLIATDSALWRQCERVLPHVLLRLQNTGTSEESLSLASLASKMAQYLGERGQYATATSLLQRALRIREHVLGQEHLEVATLLSHLASLSYQQGRYAQAERLYQRVLRTREQALGPDHLEVASVLAGMARLYVQQGRYTEAEHVHHRALRIQEQALGPHDLQVAETLKNLAITYRRQGNYAQAESLLRRSVQIQEQRLAPDHPHLASPIYNLANLYLEQGNYDQAEPLFLRAWHLWEQGFGPENPHLAYALNALGILYTEQGNYNQAEPLFLRALHLWEQELGADHPHLASTLQELAKLFIKQEKYDQAEPLFQRALRIREQHLGPEHSDTALTLYELALFHQIQDQRSEALSLASRALAICSHVLGDTHPQTIAAQTLSTQLLQEQVSAQVEAAVALRSEEVPDPRRNERHEAVTPVPSKDDPLQEFLEACCDLHPRAWCRSADLWQAYERWVEQRQERYPLSRVAFTQQLKAAGCRTDRTNSARIWRGITLVNHKTVTGSDRR